MNARHNREGYRLLHEQIVATNDHRPTRRLSKDGGLARDTKRYINSKRTKLSPRTKMDGADAIEDVGNRWQEGKHHM